MRNTFQKAVQERNEEPLRDLLPLRAYIVCRSVMNVTYQLAFKEMRQVKPRPLERLPARGSTNLKVTDRVSEY